MKTLILDDMNNIIVLFNNGEWFKAEIANVWISFSTPSRFIIKLEKKNYFVFSMIRYRITLFIDYYGKSDFYTKEGQYFSIKNKFDIVKIKRMLRSHINNCIIKANMK